MTESLKILLLEDNRTDAEIIHRLLKKEVKHADFLLAMNKKDFLSALDNFAPTLILSDNSLPRFNATEALAIIKERSPHIPFILITGTVSEEYAANIIKLGADDYILKDRLARLPAAIDTALRQRKIEKEKQLSEKKYQTIFLKSPLPTWIFDTETLRFLEVNETAIRHYGYSAEEFLNMTIKDIRPPEEVDALLMDIKGIPGDIDTRRSTWRHRKKNGEIIIVETTAHTIEHNNKNARMVVINDITEKEKAEQKIIQSEENLKAIFDNSSEGFVLLDDQCMIKVFNSRAGEMLQSNLEEEMKTGRSIFDFVEPMRKIFFKEVLSMALQGQTIQYDRSYKSKGKATSWINFLISPVWKNGVIDGTCITAQDITGKKMAEQQKEFDHNNLHAMINNTHDMMWSVDKELRLITSNQAFNKVVELIAGKKLEKGEYVLMPAINKQHLERYKQYYQRAMSGETFTVTERTDLPALFWSETSFYPIYEKQKVIGTACFSRDITEKKKAEAELRRLEEEQLQSRIEEQQRITRAMLRAQEKERNDIGIELHDNVNQILVGTMLTLSLVKSNDEKDKELIATSQSHLQNAVQENRKIAHVFVAPDLDTESLVTQLEKLFGNMLITLGVEVLFDSVQLREELLDSDRKFNIYRIAQEQCTNIVKYAKATSVQIKVSTENDSFTMIISDNGIGMDAGKKASGIGLRNINGRLALFNGTANIITETGKGFTLEISIPVTMFHPDKL